jgi:NAD(P)-dependent dehydrogenase (short-subunit alcohol dehydrogenase family)
MVSTIRKQPANKGDAAYYASQVGLIGLSHAAARELSIYNIRVNTICQGLNELDLLSPLGWDVAVYRTWREAYPNLSRSKHPELVSLALYLCSQAASSLTGQVVSVNL